MQEQRQRFVGYKADVDTITLLLQGDYFIEDSIYIRICLDISGNVYLHSPESFTKIGTISKFSPLIICLPKEYKRYEKEVKYILNRHDKLPINLIMSYRKFRPSKTVIRRLRKKGITVDLFSVEQEFLKRENIRVRELVDGV